MKRKRSLLPAEVMPDHAAPTSGLRRNFTVDVLQARREATQGFSPQRRFADFGGDRWAARRGQLA